MDVRGDRPKLHEDIICPPNMCFIQVLTNVSELDFKPLNHLVSTNSPVGPVGRQPEPLKQCYTTCLEQLSTNNIRTIAFCGISTGIYKYPLYAGITHNYE